jgi:hypothetical protein
MRPARLLLGAISPLALLVGSVATAADVGASNAPAKVLADGLSSPKGIDVSPEGDPVLGQGAFGPPGPVVVVPQHGPDRGEVIPLTDPFNLTDLAISPLDGTGWGIGPTEVEGEEHVLLYHELADGTIVPVLDITLYQVGDPDPFDQDDFPEESNPYGLTIMPNGDALVSDAAGNDIIRVTPEGDAWTVARFDLRVVSTDHLPPDFELEPGVPVPPELTAEAVPTTVTIGPDGAIYVGQLMGFPFRPGTSNIWRIEPDAMDALCSTTTADPDCSVYLTGFTAIQDMDFNLNNGKLYVYELAAEGVLAFEAGFETGEWPDAVLLLVSKNGSRRELAAGQLSQPGGVAASHNGQVFVTDGMFTEGRLLRVSGG